MARTNQQRYDGAIDYITRNISPGLANAINLEIAGQEQAAGRAISLKGNGFWYKGTEQQHWALRSLLLCQQAFLLAPDIDPFVRSVISLDRTKTHYHGKPEDSVKGAIRCFETKNKFEPRQ